MKEVWLSGRKRQIANVLNRKVPEVRIRFLTQNLKTFRNLMPICL